VVYGTGARGAVGKVNQGSATGFRLSVDRARHRRGEDSRIVKTKRDLAAAMIGMDNSLISNLHPEDFETHKCNHRKTWIEFALPRRQTL
jgi:hypothetical protein